MLNSSRSPFRTVTITALIVIGAVNCIMTVISISRAFYFRKPTYTYLDGDFPVQLPLSTAQTVEMTFQESIRFNFSQENTDSIWYTLATNQPGVGFVHIGPYHLRFIPSAQHQLHCLQQMQVDFPKPNRTKDPHSHFAHCIQYLRQIFLCNADATLEEGDFMEKDFSVDRVGSTRQCRNWPSLFDYVEKNFESWERFNGVYED